MAHCWGPKKRKRTKNAANLLLPYCVSSSSSSSPFFSQSSITSLMILHSCAQNPSFFHSFFSPPLCSFSSRSSSVRRRRSQPQSTHNLSLNSSHSSYSSSNGPNPCLFSAHPAPVSPFSLISAHKMLKELLCLGLGLGLCLDFWVLPLLPKRLAFQRQVCWWVANTHFLRSFFFRRSVFMWDWTAAAATTTATT